MLALTKYDISRPSRRKTDGQPRLFAQWVSAASSAVADPRQTAPMPGREAQRAAPRRLRNADDVSQHPRPQAKGVPRPRRASPWTRSLDLQRRRKVAANASSPTPEGHARAPPPPPQPSFSARALRRRAIESIDFWLLPGNGRALAARWVCAACPWR